MYQPAYDRGWESAMNGGRVTDVPSYTSTIDCDEWVRGFNDACFYESGAVERLFWNQEGQ